MNPPRPALKKLPMETITVKAAALSEKMGRKFQTAGLSQTQAALAADAILDAERSGVASHGLVRFPVYLKQLREGIVNPRAAIKIIRRDSAVQVDGDNALGILAAHAAMDACITGAKEGGICAAAVSHSNHFGAAAYYTRQAAAEGCIGFICTVAGPTMAPFGGRELLLGTNPFSVSFPYGEELFTLDMSSSAAAKGKIRVYASQGKELPLGWALDAQGSPTTDPKKAIDGIILPMAGHKGYGIALVIEALSAILSGANLSAETVGMFGAQAGANIGHFALAIDIGHFLSLGDFKVRAGTWLAMLADSQPLDGFDRVLIPGQPESRGRKSSADELQVDAALYASLFDDEGRN